MSGIEIFGIAASVLQIADLGTRVSVKLFGFARKVRGAAEKIDIISKEIAATGALLQQLSEQLDKDSKTQLLRRELVDSANDLVQECNKIFKNIDKAIDGNSGNKIILSLKQKVQYTYLESEIDALRMNLENLKSSICIMQNVLIYAEQLRNRERFPVLKEQQDLLKALSEEKSANEQRYSNLMKALMQSPDSRLATSSPPGFASAQLSAVHVPLGSRSEQFAADVLQRNSHSPSPKPPDAQMALDEEELREYVALMAHILREVRSKSYDLTSQVRCRVQKGVLEIHCQEWAPFRSFYGDDVLLKKFHQIPELHRFWLNKIGKQGVTHSEGQLFSTEEPRVEKWPSSTADRFRRRDKILNPPDRKGSGLALRLKWDMAEEARREVQKQQKEMEELKLREVEELKSKRKKEEERVLDEKSQTQVSRNSLKKRNSGPPTPINTGTISSKADIFEAKVASAVDEANSSDTDETFVYESNPPEPYVPRSARHHSRTPSATSLASQVDQYGGRCKSDGSVRNEDLQRASRPHSSPTFVRVERRHLSKDTLNCSLIPWEVDQKDPSYIVIKQFVDNDTMQMLLQDTRERRARALVGSQGVELTSSPQHTHQLHEERPINVSEGSVPLTSATPPDWDMDDIDEYEHGQIDSVTSSNKLEKMERPFRFGKHMKKIGPVSSNSNSRPPTAPPPYAEYSDDSEADICMVANKDTKSRISSAVRIPISRGKESDEKDGAENAVKALNVQSLLSQWTTLSPNEIARGDDPTDSLSSMGGTWFAE